MLAALFAIAIFFLKGERTGGQVQAALPQQVRPSVGAVGDVGVEDFAKAGSQSQFWRWPRLERPPPHSPNDKTRAESERHADRQAQAGTTHPGLPWTRHSGPDPESARMVPHPGRSPRTTYLPRGAADWLREQGEGHRVLFLGYELHKQHGT